MENKVVGVEAEGRLVKKQGVRHGATGTTGTTSPEWVFAIDVAHIKVR